MTNVLEISNLGGVIIKEKLSKTLISKYLKVV